MSKLSILSTLYHSETYIDEFYERCIATLKKLKIDEYEFVFVNDGSPDDSLQKALELHHKDNNVKVINLSRNFGHHKAIMTGLEHCAGDFVFLIDIDLEEEPELLEDFWNKAQSDLDIDVVYGVQKSRQKDTLDNLAGRIWYYTFNKMSENVRIPKNFTTIRLMNRKFVSAMNTMRESDFYLAPSLYWVGFNQQSVPFDKKNTSPTTYSLLKKYHIFINTIFTYSHKPLYFIFYSGFMITALSFLMAIFFTLQKILGGTDSDGWASIIVSIWFLGGTIILFLGIIAIYVSKIFTETKNRPFSIIHNIWDKTGDNK